MRRSPLCCSLFCSLMLLAWQGVETLQCGEKQYRNKEGQCAPCIQCPPGQEPKRACRYGRGLITKCRGCSPGSFSDSYEVGSCVPHTRCDRIKRMFVSAGTATTDTRCGDCLPGFYAPVEKSSSVTECLPCVFAPIGTAGCQGFMPSAVRVRRSADAHQMVDGKATSNGTTDEKPEEKTSEFAVLAIVPIFCLTGLLGILLCNFLKKKGYHCMSEKEAEEEAGTAEKGCAYVTEDANEDTIGILVRLITEKKENAAALEELLKEYHNKELAVNNKNAANKLQPLPALPHLCRHQHHLHTIQGLAPRSGTCCSRCSQKKWPEVLLSPTAAAAAAAAATATKGTKPVTKIGRPGEIMTILSVGRFRVARIPEQKPNSAEEKLPPEPSSRDPVDVAPVEQKSLLANGTKVKVSKPAEEKKEMVL
ncbi:tumor necrosis factor receptor superfamily member 19L isoform X2 [Latimeria chalumnae]|uniref:tumor necrosis factor receptor superfamily member 19L isoform X2 n=1 Tax=Latimeria chalumnae TaxID=7897 RepID=UPI0003C11305|nr:PREDICTED: tumor necrosis factor receptor superfamily member 19L isoform X2 [Latimeria chalumnae]|eukprot:XP_006001449.1 PREDICTED: tumor necrosis factor receptor superfamily member 19L isoform X2 [Latimeria chalumnae]